jgi:hypothetical protein
MKGKRRFSVIEHWTCDLCSGAGQVYEDASEQQRFLLDQKAQPFGGFRHPLTVVEETAYRSNRVPCRGCKGEGRGQREVSLEEALKELGILPSAPLPPLRI